MELLTPKPLGRISHDVVKRIRNSYGSCAFMPVLGQF